jgi:hypothetical protein
MNIYRERKKASLFDVSFEARSKAQLGANSESKDEIMRIELETAGHSLGNLICDSLDAHCGQIHHGLGFSFTHNTAGWVVSLESIETVYLAAKKYRDGRKLDKATDTLVAK